MDDRVDQYIVHSQHHFCIEASHIPGPVSVLVSEIQK